MTTTKSCKRGTDSNAFQPSMTNVPLALNSRKFSMKAEHFLEPGFIASEIMAQDPEFKSL
ncbi:LOW QUALITY PROTEIN: hypothetical protein PHMEG_00024180 [Phytophthora megakarya]|uniref:Uncharacterized protein n=1 Tax=Phytophthora megakarya TaxID=4795 RepID=A0A225VGK4_9STRA|nr:LOW QUALITY PROTEIN: hypothetical protein PHMEG_00024180 [Phytophthora megakarya]